MPKKPIRLTDLKIKSTKPTNKPFKLFDGEGLFLFITPSGGKLWRMKYRFGGTEKLLSFGSYPTVTLSDAREKLSKAKALIDKGIDPGEAKKTKKAEESELTHNTFENIAREWFEKFSERWSQSTADKKIRRLEVYVFPYIGNKPIKEIKSPDVLDVLRKIELRGILETAKRVRIVCGQIFNYAIATGRAENDPTSALKGALPPSQVKHFAAITEPDKAAELLRAIDGYQGTFVVQCAFKLAPLFFVRPGELRQAEWTDINFEENSWKFVSPKKDKPHIVPLARQAVEILKELHSLTGSGRFVFPSTRTTSRPMSENTITAALRRMGYTGEEMTGHGFRAMARTLMDEVLQMRPDFLEHQLAHTIRDPLGRAYNRTSHLDERRKMMQTWADYLDGLKAGAKVIPFKAQAV